MADISDETLALAALFQSCQQIQRVAYTGYQDDHAAACVLGAIIVTDPQTVEDVYAPGRLLTGLRQMIESFSPVQSGTRNVHTIETTRIAFKIIALTVNLMRSRQIFGRLGAEIDRLHEVILQRHPDFMRGDPEVVLASDNLSEFSGLYRSLISPNFSKLIIHGEEQYLREQQNQERIRALLLAAVRAAVLWRQIGGRRRYLLFRRRQILECAQQKASTGFSN